ncbi:MAG TPA: carboxypeptidase-like regulatory domain-containing protein, partial [Thermoanaerobaculia bacterium]
MKPRLFVTFFALLIATAASAATISGTVTPAPGMVVEAYDASGNFVAQATTNSSGGYTLTVNPGAYHLLAYDPTAVYATSYYADADSFETSTLLNVNGDLTNINFALVKAGYLAGTVTSQSGTPLPDITVAAYNTNGTRRGFTQTDSAGHYVLAVPPGTYAVAAFDTTLTYVTTFYNGRETFSSADLLGVTVSQTAIANFALPEAVHISGTVTDTTGAPLNSVIVNAYSNSGIVFGTTTDASGHYQLSLRSGTYRLVFEDPNGTYAALYYPNAESFLAASAVTAPATNVNATLAAAGHLTGTVRSSGGSLLSNVLVAAYNPDGSIRTVTFATNGQYTLVVPPGMFKVIAFDTSGQYANAYLNGAVSFETESSLTVASSQTISGLDLVMQVAGTVNGSVVDAVSGAPLGNILIDAYDANGFHIARVGSSISGAFALALPPGTYKFVASDPLQHYAPSFYDGATSYDAAQAVPISSGQSVSVVFRMSIGT